jgi:hypothetical protein
MTTAKIYLPKQWTDSPWALLFEYEAPAMRNAVLLGVLIILAELVELSLFEEWEEWINVALGAWLVGRCDTISKDKFYRGRRTGCGISSL